jgi:hypothetical protein
MVEVKKQIAPLRTVVKIGVDDTGAIRVTTGNTPWVDLDEEDEEDEEDDYEEPQSCSSPVYHPTEINYDGKRYVLREPLQCEVTLGTGNDTYCIDYEPLGIWGAGETWKQAVDFFSFQFACKYDGFRTDKVAKHFLPAVKLMNEIVIKVE